MCVTDHNLADGALPAVQGKPDDSFAGDRLSEDPGLLSQAIKPYDTIWMAELQNLCATNGKPLY